MADLEAYSGPLTNNDYAFVETTDTAGNTYYDRYKYTTATTPAEWQFEYELNNSSFTSNQWAAINSGVTSGDVTLISTATQPGDNVSTLVNDAGYLTSSSIGNGPTVFKKNGAAFATITANQTSTVNVDYTIPTTASDVGALPDSTIIGNANTTILVNSTSVGTINANQTTAGSVNISVPTDTTDLTNGAGYITGISSSDVTTALGYTPYNSSNPDGYTSNLGTVTSVNNVLPISGNVNVHTRNIGEIVISTLPLTDAGLHLLDGSLIQYGSYSAFIDYIADIYDSGDYPDLFDTEANWQSAVAAHSVCGKFVYDSVNNTVRLPKITGIIEGTTDLTALGALVEAGLPNITGATSYVFNSSDSTVAGALHNDSYVSSYGVAPSSSGTNKARTLTFDASDSNSIYGNSATVQPQTIKTLYYIVIAALSKTEIEVDIDEIATDLNGKADTDLTNLTATASPNIDGQWVITDTIINNNANKAIGTYYFPLSSYLPNDGYKYEVMVHLYGASSSSAASTAVLAVWSDIFTLPGTSASYAQVIATTTTRVGTSDFTLPVGDERKIYYQIFSNEFATIYMRLYGYRRIGTNS